jgi:hypothetical protein
MKPSDAAPRPPSPFEHLAPVVAALISLAPFVLYTHRFADLYWFGDEFDLIDQIDRLSFWKWTWLVFAENFVPLFKILWGGAVLAFHGSYFAMLALLWLTHAANTLLLGRVLRAAALPWPAVFFAQIGFALAAVNVETLTWTLQWSAVLASTFLLCGLDWHLRTHPHLQPFSWRAHGPLLAFTAASAFSFSRGILTGAVLALASFCPSTQPHTEPLGRRVLNAAVCLGPALLAATVIVVFASGNHQHLRGHVGDAAAYGVWYFSLNPAHGLLGVDSLGWRTVALLGIVKLALVVWALARSRGNLRTLFVLLLAFDVGNAVLLGVGRYHTGLESTVSSRYQYTSLLCVLPFAGFWLAQQWMRVSTRFHLSRVTAAAVLLGMGWLVAHQWPSAIRIYSVDRGSESRRILLQEPNPPPTSVPGIDFLPVDRARELIRKYNLH